VILLGEKLVFFTKGLRFFGGRWDRRDTSRITALVFVTEQGMFRKLYLLPSSDEEAGSQ
jgi:hypothetical protein